jgi:hypothetical protein
VRCSHELHNCPIKPIINPNPSIVTVLRDIPFLILIVIASLGSKNCENDRKSDHIPDEEEVLPLAQS